MKKFQTKEMNVCEIKFLGFCWTLDVDCGIKKWENIYVLLFIKYWDEKMMSLIILYEKD